MSSDRKMAEIKESIMEISECLGHMIYEESPGIFSRKN